MKKLLLIFILCSATLFGLMFSYADEQNTAFSISEDLPLLLSKEPSAAMKQLNENSAELQSIIAEQRFNLNILNSICYLGSYTGSFDGLSLQRSLEWRGADFDKAPLFNSEAYSDYYHIRTAKILEKYQYSEAFDCAAFIKNARTEFDSFIVSEKNNAQLMVLLQDKHFDKLVELEPAQRKQLFEEVLALRLPENNSKYLDNLYQQFEGRVRLQLLTEMVEINQKKLEALANKIGMIITSDKKGQLQLIYKDSQNKEVSVHIINVLGDDDGYRGLVKLYELYKKTDIRLIFTEEEGSSHEIDMTQAYSAIALDNEGYVHLNLDSLINNQKVQEVKSEAPAPDASIDNELLKSAELLYASRTKAAQEIVRELNRYGMYLELKDNKISNLYTRSFEAELMTWKKNLDLRLNSFGTAGTADFIAYIKLFSLLDRNPSKNDKERTLIAKFRNSDIQFRKTEDCSIWITDILYRLKYLQQ